MKSDPVASFAAEFPRGVDVPAVSRAWLTAKAFAAVLGGCALVAAAPLVATSYQLSVLLLVFMYIALASSWNLIGGYTGYFTFGHVAYFGIGAYCSSLLITGVGLHWMLATLLGALAAAFGALLVGFPSLKVKGPAFVILTLAFSQALRIAVQVADTWTGGGRGLSLPPTQSLVPVYFAFALAAVVAVGGSWVIERTAFGRKLKAIRDDELAAEVTGIDTQKEKLKAFALSALLPGFCGGVYAWYLSYISPDEAFSLRINVSMIVMVLLGGAGTVLGPVLGAVILFGISEVLWAKFPSLHQLMFGLVLIALVLFAPQGLLGWIRRERKLKVERGA